MDTDEGEDAVNNLPFVLPCVVPKASVKRMLQLSYAKLKESFSDKKKPETNIMLGAFWCISEMAKVCPSFFQEDPKLPTQKKGQATGMMRTKDARGEQLFEYIMTVLSTFSKGGLSRFEVVRVVLSILKNRSHLLRVPLCQKAVQVYTLMYDCLVGKQCSSSEVNQLLEGCIFKLVTLVSKAAVYKEEDVTAATPPPLPLPLEGTTGDVDTKAARKKLFNQFMGEFTSLIVEGVSKLSPLDHDLQTEYGPFGVCRRIGVYGIGNFASAIRANLGKGGLSVIEGQLWNCIDNISNFLDVSEASGNATAWAIGRAELLSSISKVISIRVTRELSDATVEKIQEEMIALVVAYPTQWKTKRWVLSKAIADILKSFGTDASVSLTTVAETVVHHALLRSISMSESREETNQMEQQGLLYDPITGLVDIRLLHSYVAFWDELISPQSYFWDDDGGGHSSVRFRTNTADPHCPTLHLPTMLCDHVVTEVVDLIAHFDLTYVTPTASAQPGTAQMSARQLHASLSLHPAAPSSLQLSKSSSVSSQTSSVDSSSLDALDLDVQRPTAFPRTPGDHILFNNLTCFLEALLECHSERAGGVGGEEEVQDRPNSRLRLLEEAVVRHFVPFFGIVAKQCRLCNRHASLYRLQGMLLHIADKHHVFDTADGRRSSSSSSSSSSQQPSSRATALPPDPDDMGSSCFHMVEQQLISVSKQFDSFSDDILIAALRFVLNAPVCFLHSNVRHYVPVLRRALLVGLTHEPTAHAAVSALHKCYDIDGGCVVKLHAHDIFPLLEPYLLPKKKDTAKSSLSELKSVAWSVKSDAMKKKTGHILKQTKANKDRGGRGVQGPVSGIQNQIMRFLGRVGGESQSMLASGHERLKKSLAWDPDALSLSSGSSGPKKWKQVNVRLPFPKSKFEVNLVGLLPRLTGVITDPNPNP